MTPVNQLLQGSVKPGSEQNEKLLAALVRSYEATAGLFEMYSLAEIVNHFTGQVHAIAGRLPEEGDDIGVRREIQDGIYFNVEVLQQLILMHTQIEAVNKIESVTSKQQDYEGALAYSKIMMQRTLRSAEERVN